MNLSTKRLVIAFCCMMSVPVVSFASTASPTHPTQTRSQHASTNKTTHAVSNSYTYVTVRKGDSLWSIAHRYRISVTSLEKWNALNSKSVLHIGQRLKVGVASVASVSSDSLSSRSGDVGPLGADVFGLEIAAFAQKFVGVPYQWGGRSPSGFDCSGFVGYVFKHYGVSLPRTSYDMFGVGSTVSRSGLMPGDLVFSDTYGGGASHVGIYVGGGRFISAESGGVRMASLSESYWSRHFVGGRHVGK